MKILIILKEKKEIFLILKSCIEKYNFVLENEDNIKKNVEPIIFENFKNHKIDNNIINVLIQREWWTNIIMENKNIEKSLTPLRQVYLNNIKYR